MIRTILFLFFCEFLLSCNNSKTGQGEKKNETNGAKINSNTILNNLHFCTELPKITTDTSKKDIRQVGGLKYLLWPKNTKVLNVAFLDGDPVVQEKIKKVAKEWENYCGIVLNFGTTPKPDITISFKYHGSWSYIGTSSQRESPSMNFGWITATTDDEEYHRVVLHEFGHALGLIHEHQNPNNNPINWSKELVYEYYMNSQNWSKEDVDNNLFTKYNEDEINGTSFDPKSIMLYSFPKELTTDGFSTGWNTVLSENDKNQIRRLYPKR
jgi:serralysin